MVPIPRGADFSNTRFDTPVDFGNASPRRCQFASPPGDPGPLGMPGLRNGRDVLGFRPAARFCQVHHRGFRWMPPTEVTNVIQPMKMLRCGVVFLALTAAATVSASEDARYQAV